MNDDKYKSTEEMRRELERELESLDYRDDLSRRRRRPNNHRDDKARSQELYMRVIAGLFIAVISFLGTEMYDLHNQLIGVDQKMRLLVTPDFQIVPSGKHASHELAREVLESRIVLLEDNIGVLTRQMQEMRDSGNDLRKEYMAECLKKWELIRIDLNKLEEEVTTEYRREISQEIKAVERRIDILSQEIKKDRSWL